MILPKNDLYEQKKPTDTINDASRERVKSLRLVVFLPISRIAGLWIKSCSVRVYFVAVYISKSSTVGWNIFRTF